MIRPPSAGSDLRQNLLLIARARMCWLVVLLVIAIQILVLRSGDARSLYEAFGLSKAGLLAGKIWQIITHGFLHGGWWHLTLNSCFLLLLGSRMEHIVGSAVLMRVILMGILGGGVLHIVLGSGLLVGLSGACMALLLLLTTLSPQSRMMPLPVTARSLGLGMFIATLFLTLINPQLRLPGFSSIGMQIERLGLGSWFQLGHACHLGGALVGWIYGRWILRPRVTLASLQKDRIRRGQD